MTGGSPRLRADAVSIGYDDRAVSRDLSLEVPDGSFTVVVGPNACGKSTLLRALARLLRPTRGTVVLDGRDIHSRPAKEVARRLGLLPQTSVPPDGIRVADLVARGRYPHQGILRQWSDDDERAVIAALRATGTEDLSERLVDRLSGGQRQRVWVAMVLAQETPLLLLDEPTTFLDIAHQIELMDLFRRLHREGGRTLVAVLHDLNQAARYATHVVAMKDGAVVAEGTAREVFTRERIGEVFGLACEVVDDPFADAPLIIPVDRG